MTIIMTGTENGWQVTLLNRGGRGRNGVIGTGSRRLRTFHPGWGGNGFPPLFIPPYRANLLLSTRHLAG